MSLSQIKLFLNRIQNDIELKKKVINCSTADEVALIGSQNGFVFSGDELLRFSGKKVGKVTLKKNDIPGEYS